MLWTRPPSKKCSSPTRTGGSRPGTAAEASTAGTTGPLVNQWAAARSMLAATHWKGTARSSIRDTGSSSSSRRSGSLSCRWVPERASVLTRPNSEPRNASPAAPSRHTRASRGTAAAGSGSAATNTPVTAPTEVPRIRSGRMPASASAWSMPTSCAPSTPPPPSTKAISCRCCATPPPRVRSNAIAVGTALSDRRPVARHGVVGAVAPHHACQPPSLLGDGLIPTSLELVFDLSELGPHPLGDRDPPHPEPPVPPLPADMRETEELKRLRLAQAPRPSTFGGVPAELDEPGLVGMQLQPELREAFAKVGEEPLCVGLPLKARGEVVRKAHDDHIPVRVAAPPPVGPQVEDVVQVDVRQQRRCRCPLRRALHRLRPVPVLDDPCGQPLADQPQDPPVRDPVLEEPLQPAVIKAGEEVADVRVEHPVHLLLPDPDRQRIQRLVRAAPQPEPVGETQEVRLVDGVEHLDDGPLKNLVFQRGNAERPRPPVRLRDVGPPRRPCPVTPCMHPVVQVGEIRLQLLPVGRPRHPVHPRRSLRADRPVRHPETIDVNVVQQRREPRVLVPSCHFTHTVQRTWRACSGAVSGTRFAGRVPLGWAPFLHRLRRRTRGLVHRFRRYYAPI